MNKKYLIVSIITIAILSLGVSLAYWLGSVTGEGANMSITIGEARIIFDKNNDLNVVNNDPIVPGWTLTKTFSIKSESDSDYKFDIVIKDLVNTFKTNGFLQYKITSTNGGESMSEYKDIPKSNEASNRALLKGITISPNETQDYVIEIIYRETEEDQSSDMGAELSGTIFISEHDPRETLYDKILADHAEVKSSTDRGSFDSPFGTEEATTGVIYKESVYKEDGLDVYYFAGNVADNWVKFADFYWRIIRTNEDGSVRLLYAGTSPDTTSGYINASQPYNGTYNNTMYVGWMYGSTGSITNNRGYTNSAPIKTTTENWYRDNIANNASYNNLVSTDAIYCNDRASGEYASSGSMSYAARDRLHHQGTAGRQPSYKCGQNSVGGYSNISDNWVSSTSAYTSSTPSVTDKFSKTTGSGGNGQLTYPVGLITADEIAFAGGLYNTNSPNAYYYLNSAGESVTGEKWWWAMSSSGANSSSDTFVFLVHGSSYPGSLSNSYVYDSGAVRPVVSLKSNVLVSGGTGTASNPYMVEAR